ncbi:hypothetical protein EWM64_g2841 [Hericium alpestre]|uniref:Metallo-beta-lactamase domain-containing protein n=1 Tax=Hericium alpestre TaxID=135208 RepID=A0A4Z0A3Y6_9AGAM|nr:hypothetical protein EWM64_g2841 [Hericium alpestre]
MGDTIIREVTKGVWTFSRPFTRLGLLRIGGRSTAIKLQNGDVWVLASTPLCQATKDTLAKLGPVKYLIGADSVHHLFLGEYHKEYPEAQLIAVEEAVNKRKADGLKFAGYWGDNNLNPKFGFESEVCSSAIYLTVMRLTSFAVVQIEHCYFSGFRNKDVAFWHKDSKSLIEADLLFNLPPTEQYSKSWFSGGLPFVKLTPYSWAQQSMMKNLSVNDEAMKRDVKTVASWDFERIIPCHGDVIEKDGNKAWRTLYQHFLEEGSG